MNNSQQRRRTTTVGIRIQTVKNEYENERKKLLISSLPLFLHFFLSAKNFLHAVAYKYNRVQFSKKTANVTYRFKFI